MVHGPQPGSIGELCSSSEPADHRRGDAAALSFGRLVCVQLIALTVLMALLSFSPPLQRWMEDSEKDACMASTQVMTCLDWGLNVLLFVVLLPVTLLTVRVRSVLFRWSLWAVWSVTLVMDLALFLAAYPWRAYAVAVCGIMVGFVTIFAALSHLPRSILLFTWEQAYNGAVKTGLVGGLILIIATQDASYAYVALATPIATVFILYCCQLILDACPPDQAVLGSMFVLFPEGLLLALWIMRRGNGGAARETQVEALMAEGVGRAV